MTDNASENVTIHINERQRAADVQLGLFMLTQYIIETYTGAEITEHRDTYGNIVDVIIKFATVDDAAHFRLSHMD
jgi:hypothetical protein